MSRTNKSTEAENNEVYERIKLMFDAMPLGCHLWNSDLKMIDCNEAALKLYGFKNKQEQFDNFSKCSPEYQPDGQRSDEKAVMVVKKAFEEGYYSCEWLHQTWDGALVPVELTLERLKHGDDYVVAAYTRDLRDIKEAHERIKLMLDAMPLGCHLVDSSFKMIDCNEAALQQYGFESKQELFDNFSTCSPKYQPDGRRSDEKAVMVLKKAFSRGYFSCEWMHQTRDGTPVPVKLTLVRFKYGAEHVVAAYTKDLRDIKEAHERVQLMLDAMPLGCHLWNSDFQMIDCNEASLRLYGFKTKEEQIRRFPESSPEYQPDGQRSDEKAVKMVKKAFEDGYYVCEWMHQTLSGKPIPVELTLVRIKSGDGYVVAAYTRDLRSIKKWRRIFAGWKQRPVKFTMIH